MAATQIERAVPRTAARGTPDRLSHNRANSAHASARACWPSTMMADSAQTVPASRPAAWIASLRGPGSRCFPLEVQCLRGRRRRKSGRARRTTSAPVSSRPREFPAVPDVRRGLRSPGARQKETPAQFISADPTMAESCVWSRLPLRTRFHLISRRDRHREGEWRVTPTRRPALSGSFVAVNCAALPDSLIEAELSAIRRCFHRQEGAARPDCSGRPTAARFSGESATCRDAAGGSAALLDDWNVRPVGGSKREVRRFCRSPPPTPSRRFDRQSRFRSDLLFRLNTRGDTAPCASARFSPISRATLWRRSIRRVELSGCNRSTAEHDWNGKISASCGTFSLGFSGRTRTRY